MAGRRILTGVVASLAPPFVLGVAIDAVFNRTRGYELPPVPAAWVPAGRAGQFWLSFALMFGFFASRQSSRPSRC